MSQKNDSNTKIQSGMRENTILPNQCKSDFYKLNPHLNQHNNFLPVDSTRPIRYLNEVSGFSPPGEFKNRCLSTCHWGQRKLLMSELEFILDYSSLYDHHEQKHIIYAGAGPGTHIAILAQLFPEIHFSLFDKIDFNIESENNVFVYKEYFTNETAKYYQSVNNILFISDIRSGTKGMGHEEFENCVGADNHAQLQWHRTIQPLSSMLKFRLPFLEEKYHTYAAGRIYLPVWGPQKTTETRLVPHKKNIFKYDLDVYKGKMKYFNNIIRSNYYINYINYPNIYDGCYDCAREIVILNRLRKFLNLKYSIVQLSLWISRFLTKKNIGVLEYKRR